MTKEQLSEALFKLVLGRRDSIDELAEYLASLKTVENPVEPVKKKAKAA